MSLEKQSFHRFVWCTLTLIAIAGKHNKRVAMKITAVEAIPIDRYLYAKIYTAADITGLGESGAWGFLEASEAAHPQIRRLSPPRIANYVGVVPHNPPSPVSTAACLQLAACIPNFTIQECPFGELEPPKSEIIKTPLTLQDGFLIIPTSPGIRIELTENAAEKYPPVHRKVETRLNTNGSVLDQ